MPRYANIYKDREYKDGRYILRVVSDKDFDTREEAESFPSIDEELRVETVRLLSKEEESNILSRLEWERKRAKWYAEMMDNIGKEAATGIAWRKRKRNLVTLVIMYRYLIERSGRKAV